MYGISKITYWKKYGVQRFPYRGKRRYTPSINQSYDGGIIISNDVFGLTISQFEKMYKDCLDRRKQREQWILNLRYPNKSSNEYLEYLQNCTDCNKEQVSWSCNEFKEKCLYQHSVNTVGTELDIRTRQRLFIIKDMIDNASISEGPIISSGSLAEGLDLPGSDVDIMGVLPDVHVLRRAHNIKHPKQGTTLVMETDIYHPGFARLRIIADEASNSMISKCIKSTTEGSYVSVHGFINETKKRFQLSSIEPYSHGPCITDMDQLVDVALCLKSQYFPYQAIAWAFRHRKQWPPNNVIEKIINYGCLLVPIGPRTLSDDILLWRLSFSVAEKQLVHSFNFTQLLCYGLLKLTLKCSIYTNDDIKDLLCSYFLKTALFWVSEEVNIDTFQLPKLFTCFCLCVNKIISWVSNCYCPNYFIPEQNMFLGRITRNNNKILLYVLESILIGGIDGLITNLFQHEIDNYHVLCTNTDISFIMNDFLFFRVCGFTFAADISDCYKSLILTESFLKSESFPFIIDVCKYYHAKISRYLAQLLPPLTSKCKTYNIHKLYHRHLQDSIKADAVSGWLLYASYFYVTGQYNVTLRLAEYVLSKISSNMVNLGCQKYDAKTMNDYRDHVHNSVTLSDRIKLATVGCIIYMENSPLIPEELQLEVENFTVTVPPVVHAHCFRVLCYHNLDDNISRQQALHDLFLTLKHRPLIKNEELSDSFTILGVCMEISGEKDTAFQCYDGALFCRKRKSRSAEKRKSKLLDV